ncbi:OsmC family peroxiredoxin [Clostridium tetani]|uniref:OsmC family peroxiredoxin n=2 Tax=Clostridium tetani TaxID=1513 RepID=A0A4Q0VF43_CLOTA|nr:OsmC family peroxiredoxin [Clostridium tetani]
MMLQTLKATTKKLPEGLQVNSTSRGFKVLLDEPEELGGTDKGMNPMELVLCALGACQTIVAFAFAEQNGIDLEDFWVDLEGDFDADGFLGLSDVRPGYSEIRYKMHFKSNSSEEELNKFAQFIEKTCPVGDSIENGVKLVQSGIVVEK